MSGILSPKKIEDGWLPRWTKQTADLTKRIPISFLIWAIIEFTVSSGLSYIKIPGISILFDIPIFALAFTLFRVADEHHGENNFLTAIYMLRGAKNDIFYLARDFFLLMMALGAIMITFLFISNNASSTISKNAKNIGMNHYFSDIFSTIRNGQLYHHIYNAINTAFINSTTIYVPIALFVSLLVGYPGFLMILVQGQMSLAKNIKISIFFVICGIFVQLIFQMVMIFFIKNVGELGFFIASFLMIFTNWFFLGLGYLWGRESFEGRAKNLPQAENVKSAKLATVSVLSGN